MQPLVHCLCMLIQGEEGALSMTTRLRSANASKGLPVNYCSGFRSLSMASACEIDGLYVSLYFLDQAVVFQRKGYMHVKYGIDVTQAKTDCFVQSSSIFLLRLISASTSLNCILSFSVFQGFHVRVLVWR